MANADVLVVGGGIAGAAAARWLAEDHDVRLLERGRVAGEATGHASGLVSIAADYAEAPALARYALDWFDGHAEAPGVDYHARPNVGLVTSPAVAEARSRAARLREAALDVRFLDAEELGERFPGVFRLDGFGGAVVYPGGWVDPARLCGAFLDDARAEGARVETGVEATRLLVEDGAVTGVETPDDEIRAGTVVVAAGWRTRALVADLVELPIRPFRYQTANLTVERELGPEFPIGWEHETRLYWRAELNGELHVGGGAYFCDPAEPRSAVTESFRELVAETVPRRLEGVGEARIVGEACCPTGDAATPDEYPIIDEPVEGLVVATGLTGFGIMASPVVGRAVRSVVTGEPAPFPLERLGLDRFDELGTDFTLPYVVEDPADLPP